MVAAARGFNRTRLAPRLPLRLFGRCCPNTGLRSATTGRVVRSRPPRGTARAAFNQRSPFFESPVESRASARSASARPGQSPGSSTPRDPANADVARIAASGQYASTGLRYAALPEHRVGADAVELIEPRGPPGIRLGVECCRDEPHCGRRRARRLRPGERLRRYRRTAARPRPHYPEGGAVRHEPPALARRPQPRNSTSSGCLTRFAGKPFRCRLNSRAVRVRSRVCNFGCNHSARSSRLTNPFRHRTPDSLGRGSGPGSTARSQS